MESSRVCRNGSKIRGLGPALLVLSLAVITTTASASTINGFITTPDLDPIFSQQSFQPNPIDIRWLSPWTPIDKVELATIDSEQEFNALLALAPPPQGGFVDVFFVHDVLWCGEVGVWAGCGEVGGKGAAFRMVVDSDLIPQAFGDEIIAHELGHNLGLGAPPGPDHVLPNNCTNLMNATVCNNNWTLTGAQVLLLRNDTDLIRVNAQGGNFINLLPIAVPEPATLTLLGLGLAGIGAFRRWRN